MNSRMTFHSEAHSESLKQIERRGLSRLMGGDLLHLTERMPSCTRNGESISSHMVSEGRLW